MMFRRVPNKMEQTKELNGFYVFMRMETILPNFMRNWHSFTTSLVQQIVMWRNRDAKERSHIKNNNYFLVITPAFTEPGHCVLSRRAKCRCFSPYTLQSRLWPMRLKSPSHSPPPAEAETGRAEVFNGYLVYPCLSFQSSWLFPSPKYQKVFKA